jgi:hypothetical protein
MRIRIVEPRVASVDGVDLSVFQGGHVYEVDPTIATYLIVSGVAEPCADGSPALVVQSTEVMVSVFPGPRVVSDVADDWEDASWDKVPGFQGFKVSRF